jgi:predicted dehydrogenase
MTLRVGIIGFGRIGNEHAGWMDSSDTVRAVATADATPARQALARSKGLVVYDSIGDLLADDSIEAVLVSTPTSMHLDHAMAAMNAGKHVMVEKPMALDLSQAKRLVEFSEGKGLTLGVFHNRRWDVDYLTVKRAIASGVFGKVLNVESRLGQFASCVGPAAREYRPGWRNEASFGGGGLYDWGSHFVDQLWRLMLETTGAKPVRVFAQLRGNVWTRDCDDFARVLIDFDSGAVGLVEINTTTRRPLPRWHIDGVEGSASSPPSPEFDTRVWADLLFTGDSEKKTRPVAMSGAESGEDELDGLGGAGLAEVRIWEQFARALRGDGRPAVTARSVLPTMGLLDAARDSSDRGHAVDVALDFEPVPG